MEKSPHVSSPQSSEALEGVCQTVRRQLLEEYKDVFPDDLPAGLPPYREVDHRIELIPGSTPPSRPTYRLSPSELTELRKQLTDLTTAGFI